MGAQPDKAWRSPTPRSRWQRSLRCTLDARHPGAASSLRQGLEETVTINELAVTLALAKTLGNTNTSSRPSPWAAP